MVSGGNDNDLFKAVITAVVIMGMAIIIIMIMITTTIVVQTVKS